MEKHNIQEIVRYFLSKRFSEQTEEKVQRWLIKEKGSEEKEQGSLSYWNELETEVNPETYVALERVNQKIGYVKERISKITLHRRIVRIAAVLIPLFLIAGGYLYYNQSPNKQIEISVAYGNTRHLILPDSSEIWVNAGSSIRYPETFKKNQRLVYLEGEAYFSVKKDHTKPFIVKTRQLSVKVLGTKFNVKAYPDDESITTTLTSGKVEVSTPSRENRILKPNEQLTYNINTAAMNIEHVSPNETNAWMAGDIIFLDSSFKEIIHTLERRFNITIANKTGIPESKRYTVKFLKGETPNEILNILKDVVGFTYQRQGTNIILDKLQ